ncbi:hypothetical protein EIN_183480 [Entamoeba invadens IP1]|uniref:hypothetical protein n=1 Tax=Entamoeba invadens IP1 TaxID=370355 RepID=UPI0002C3EFBF|nr:hypothetical protein EIN_183480 [Entamoeba invadens IP1]ELP94061.1 hypothetical protein EIN_183480 [Entamoeba invadens IP1]|eukprot:XP_004260832.1 hypothetical protein EIN_183480 [Entamoeba invadens IP1]
MGNTQQTVSTTKVHKRVQTDDLTVTPIFSVGTKYISDSMSSSSNDSPIQESPLAYLKPSEPLYTKTDKKRKRSLGFLSPRSRKGISILKKRSSSSTQVIDQDDSVDSSPRKNTRSSKMLVFIQQTSKTIEPEILYDSNLSGFDSRVLKSAISFKENIIFVVETRQEKFGFIQHDIVTPLAKNGPTTVTSTQMELFSYTKTSSCPTFIKRKTECTKAFTVHGDESSTLLTCYGAFWIEKSGVINFNFVMKDLYAFYSGMANPLIYKSFTEKSECSRLLVLQAL